MTSRRLALVALAIVLAAGAWARLTQLGEREFWTDELNHHYAAQSIARGEGPLLPSGERYVRGLTITRAIALLQPLVDDPELAARLPSALLGTVSLILLAAITWRVGGPWAAVWATTLLAVYPEAISQSRTARFYMQQLDLGLLGLLGAWLATRPSDPRHAASLRHELPIRWASAVLAGTALFFAYIVQRTTLTVVAALGVWVATLAVRAVFRHGTAAFAHRVEVQIFALAVVVGLVLWLTGRAEPILASWWAGAHWVAAWVSEDTQKRTFYLSLLKNTLGWVLAFLPVSALVAYRAAPRLTLFLLTWLLVPLALHSLLLEWKGARYFLLPLPAMLIVTGIAAQELFRALRTGVERHLAERKVPYSQAIAMSVLTAAGMWSIATLPAFSEFRELRHVQRADEWRAAGEVLRQHPAADVLPWASTDPLMSLHFWGRVDVGVQPGSLDSAVVAAPHHPAPRVPPDIDGLPRDFYTGVPVATDPDELRRAYASAGALVVGVDTIFDTFLSPAMRTTLEHEGRELCAGRCGRIRLYYWRFEAGSSGREAP